jgi:WD domain, G-beta repeat
VSGYCVVGVFDGAQPGGDPGFAGGDGLAVASAVGAYGQAGAEPLDLADVGFALVGVRGQGEHGDAGRGGVQDQGDHLSLRVVAGQGGDRGPLVSGQACSGALLLCRAWACRPASMVSARSIWSQAAPKSSPTGPRSVPRAVQYAIRRAACGWSENWAERAWRRSWVFSAWLTAPVWTNRTRLWAKSGACGRAARQMANRRAVTWSTALPRASAAAMPSLISRSYSARSGSWLSSVALTGQLTALLRPGPPVLTVRSPGTTSQTAPATVVAAARRESPFRAAVLDGHGGRVHSVAFSPDGTLLATGNCHKTVRLWDVAARTRIATLTGHAKAVTSVAFSPDGSMLASASHDKTVRLWRLQ